MKNLNFISLSKNQMKTLKGGIIIEHLCTYKMPLSELSSTDVHVESVKEDSVNQEIEIFSNSVKEEDITNEN